MFRALLKLKHWQYFLILIGGVILFEILAIVPIMSIAVKNEKPSPEAFTMLFVMIPILTLFSIYMTYGWQWAIVNQLRDKLPEGTKMPHKRIKIFYLIPVIYLIIIIIGITTFALDIINSPDPEHYFDSEEPPVFIFVMMTLMFPMHLFTIFCIIHNMVYAGKTMKAVETQRPNVKFDDYAAEFFLIWFNIIGIWILQPRLNKIIDGSAVLGDSKNVVDDTPVVDNDEVI